MSTWIVIWSVLNSIVIIVLARSVYGLARAQRHLIEMTNIFSTLDRTRQAVIGDRVAEVERTVVVLRNVLAGHFRQRPIVHQEPKATGPTSFERILDDNSDDPV